MFIVSLIIPSELDLPHSFENNYLDYHLFEYQLIKNDVFNEIFIFNQPFNYRDIEIISKNDNRYYLNKYSPNKELNFFLSPGLTSSEDNLRPSVYLEASSLFSIEDTHIKLDVEFDKRLSNDLDFHGDKHSILTGYVREAYLLSKIKSLQVFGGRLSRNYGIPNEYSLIYSNNPFSFDHYGFSLIGNKINYSFYFSRLNDDKNSIDSEGITIPTDSVLTTKRYFSFQHLDLKILDKIQLGLSQSIVYGGENSSFEGGFVNPINFYYADQRNSLIQMNGLWQLLLSWKLSNKHIFYFDFLIDDFIINNNPDYNDRDKYSDRWGLTFKYSRIDFILNQSLSTITYSRISNDTYTSFRNYENYFYQLKSIGFPYNSYESVKFNFTSFYSLPLIYNWEINFSRKGSVSIFDVFEVGKEDFPLSPVLYSLNVSGTVSTYFLKKKINIFYKISDKLTSYDSNFRNHETTINHEIRVIYDLQI